MTERKTERERKGEKERNREGERGRDTETLKRERETRAAEPLGWVIVMVSNE